MLSYAPVDFSPPPTRYKPVLHKTGPVGEVTECNYLVMFFVIGVFFMAIVDGFK
jgi:hypothetical protein